MTTSDTLTDRLRQGLATLGAVLTGAGVLILLFVAYQLWGTGLYSARAQTELKAEFQAQAAVPDPGVTTTTTATPRPDAPPPPSGDAVAILRIPEIGLDWAVVEGVSPGDLRKGPGHYPSTPMPGQRGNAAIAGHRTTYGAPFNRLDELDPGDEIQVTTRTGTHRYRVAATKIVRPIQVEVLDPTPDARLTLTTCHPKYSAAQRLIVVATLDPAQSAAPPTPSPPPAADLGDPPAQLVEAGLSGEQSRGRTISWGLATAAVGAGWWWAYRRRRHWTTHVAGVLPFAVVLFFFYASLELILPANF